MASSHFVIRAGIVRHVLENMSRAGIEAPVSEHLEPQSLRVDVGERRQSVRELWPMGRVGRGREVSTGVRIAASHYPDAPERSATAGEGGPASQTARHAAVAGDGGMSAIGAACAGDTKRIPGAYTPG